MADPLHIHRHTISFKCAYAGIKHTFYSQPNLRFHFFTVFVVIAAGLFLRISRLDWLFIILACLWVLTAEMVNTAIESVVNLLTKEYDEEAKLAKDVSAGMVLVGAIGAVIIGLFVFIPYLF